MHSNEYFEGICREHVLSLQPSPDEADEFKKLSVELLTSDASWPPLLMNYLHRYMHRYNLYRVFKSTSAKLSKLVAFLGSRAGLPGDEDIASKLTQKCTELIVASTRQWKQEGLLVSGGTSPRKSKILREVWDAHSRSFDRVEIRHYWGFSDVPKAVPSVTNVEDCLPEAPGDNIDENRAGRDGDPHTHAAQPVSSLAEEHLDTPPYRSRDLKHCSERGEDTSGASITSSEGTQITPKCLPPELSIRGDGSPPPGSESVPTREPSTTVATLPSAANDSPALSTTSTDEPVLLPNYSDRFAQLDEDLRAEAQLIAGRETVEHAWHIFSYMAMQLGPLAACDGAVPGPGLAVAIAAQPDARIKELGSKIVREGQEKQSRAAASLSQLRKRLHLSELIDHYIREREARRVESRRQKRRLVGRLPLHEKFVDILFPDTIAWKNKDMHDNPREKAKVTFDYFIQLGEPLARMARRFGVGILLRLPTSLTDKHISRIHRPHIGIFLDYIDFLHPDLKQLTSSLSAILPSIVESGLPPRRMVLETYTPDRLGDLHSRPFNELFEFCTERDSLPNVGHRSDQVPGAGAPRPPRYPSSSVAGSRKRATDDVILVGVKKLRRTEDHPPSSPLTPGPQYDADSAPPVKGTDETRPRHAPHSSQSADAQLLYDTIVVDHPAHRSTDVPATTCLPPGANEGAIPGVEGVHTTQETVGAGQQIDGQHQNPPLVVKVTIPPEVGLGHPAVPHRVIGEARGSLLDPHRNRHRTDGPLANSETPDGRIPSTPGRPGPPPLETAHNPASLNTAPGTSEDVVDKPRPPRIQLGTSDDHLFSPRPKPPQKTGVVASLEHAASVCPEQSMEGWLPGLQKQRQLALERLSLVGQVLVPRRGGSGLWSMHVNDLMLHDVDRMWFYVSRVTGLPKISELVFKLIDHDLNCTYRIRQGDAQAFYGLKLAIQRAVLVLLHANPGLSCFRILVTIPHGSPRDVGVAAPPQPAINSVIQPAARTPPTNLGPVTTWGHADAGHCEKLLRSGPGGRELSRGGVGLQTKIVVRIQQNAQGSFSPLFDSAVLGPGITNAKFFAWFAKRTGYHDALGPREMEFRFKDSLPPTRSLIARGDDGGFNCMKRDISHLCAQTTARIPGLNEFTILVIPSR